LKAECHALVQYQLARTIRKPGTNHLGGIECHAVDLPPISRLVFFIGTESRIPCDYHDILAGMLNAALSAATLDVHRFDSIGV
jgi:hypothetical protein